MLCEMLSPVSQHKSARFNIPHFGVLQLPGVENCQNYQFRYGRHPLMELPLMINPTGCARSEPKVPTHCKRYRQKCLSHEPLETL